MNPVFNDINIEYKIAIAINWILKADAERNYSLIFWDLLKQKEDYELMLCSSL